MTSLKSYLDSLFSVILLQNVYMLARMVIDRYGNSSLVAKERWRDCDISQTQETEANQIKGLDIIKKERMEKMFLGETHHHMVKAWPE